VRITGGIFRGRQLHPPQNLPVRPTTDFAKTALFNILSNHFDFTGLEVLDLFAGAGSITCEFLSREVKSVTCVDQDYHCIQYIKKIANELKADNVQTVRANAFKYVTNADRQWNIIFADPPFSEQETDKLPELIFEKNLLKPGGWFIVEHHSKRILNSQLIPFDTRNYGSCAFTMYKNEVVEKSTGN
jgi:16S rRNA (guanine966-N2)-methyltransferase